MGLISRTQLLFLSTALITFQVIGRAHKVSIKGDCIVQEGTQAQYRITVRNTGEEDQSDLHIVVEGFHEEVLQLCSSHSDDLELFEDTLSETPHVEAFTESLAKGQTVLLTITAQAASLESMGDIKRVTLRAKAQAKGIKRKGETKINVSLFKS